MIAIENTVVSDDVHKVCFVCDLNKCKGICCVEGDAGAPLDEEEISILEDEIDEILPYLTQGGLKSIEENGVFDYDSLGNYVTPLINHRECAFCYFDEGIAKCAIEKAFEEGKVKFQKPISCHLYPIRIQKYKDFDAVNYHKWPVCEKALVNGKRLNVTVFEFLKVPLIRKYGAKWYKELEKIIKTSSK